MPAPGYAIRVAARLSPAEKLALDAFGQGLRARFGARLRRVVLFGSRARGEGRDDSDLDVLVEVEVPTREDRGAVLDLGADVGLEHHLVISPLVIAPGALDGQPIGARIASEGVAL